MKTVLSIDGGGIRGIIPALILAEIETRTGRHISELFDLVAGTSTGGILALGLVKPNEKKTAMYRAIDLAKLYEKEGEIIFSRSIWDKLTSIGGLLDEIYPSKGIDSVLDKYFGDAMLSDAVTNVIITSYEIEKRTSWFFKSYKAKDHNLSGEDLLMKDAARATSAAPIFFEPAQINLGDGIGFIDGGVIANNPAMCAYVEARAMYREETDFLVVSLGVGEHTQPILYKNAKDWGLMNWAIPILSVVFDGVGDVVDYQLRQLLPTENGKRGYYRFQGDLNNASDKMDDASSDNIHELRNLADHIIKENSEVLDQLCKQLITTYHSRLKL